MSRSWLAAPPALRKALCCLGMDLDTACLSHSLMSELLFKLTAIKACRHHGFILKCLSFQGLIKNSSWTVTQSCSDLSHWPSLFTCSSALHITCHFPLLLHLANLSAMSRRASWLSGLLPDFFCPIKASQDLNHIWKKKNSCSLNIAFPPPAFVSNLILWLWYLFCKATGCQLRKKINPKARKPRKKTKLYWS